MPPSTGALLARRLLEAFSANDVEGMRTCLAKDLRAFITNSEGGMDEVTGRDAYLDRVVAMDLPAVRFGVELTQSSVDVGGPPTSATRIRRVEQSGLETRLRLTLSSGT